MLAKLAAYTGSKILPTVLEAVKSVAADATGARKVIIEVDNSGMPHHLTLEDTYHDSGRFEEAPDYSIDNEEASVFSSEDKDGSVLTGAIGVCLYRIETMDLKVAIYWSNPGAGGYKAGGMVFNGAGHPDLTAEKLFDGFNDGSDVTANTGHSTLGPVTVTYTAAEHAKYALSWEESKK